MQDCFFCGCCDCVQLCVCLSLSFMITKLRQIEEESALRSKPLQHLPLTPQQRKCVCVCVYDLFSLVRMCVGQQGCTGHALSFVWYYGALNDAIIQVSVCVFNHAVFQCRCWLPTVMFIISAYMCVCKMRLNNSKIQVKHRWLCVCVHWCLHGAFAFCVWSTVVKCGQHRLLNSDSFMHVLLHKCCPICVDNRVNAVTEKQRLRQIYGPTSM